MPWDSARLGMRCSLSIKVFLKLTRWFQNVSKYENHSLREAILKGEQRCQNCSSSIFCEFVRNVKYQASLHIYWIKNPGGVAQQSAFTSLLDTSNIHWRLSITVLDPGRCFYKFLDLQTPSFSQHLLESLKIVCIWKSLLWVLWKRHSAHQLDKDLTVNNQTTTSSRFLSSHQAIASWNREKDKWGKILFGYINQDILKLSMFRYPCLSSPCWDTSASGQCQKQWKKEKGAVSFETQKPTLQMLINRTQSINFRFLIKIRVEKNLKSQRLNQDSPSTERRVKNKAMYIYPNYVSLGEGAPWPVSPTTSGWGWELDRQV